MPWWPAHVSSPARQDRGTLWLRLGRQEGSLASYFFRCCLPLLPPIIPQSSTGLSYLVPVGFELDLIWVMMLEALCVFSLALLCTPRPDTRRYPGELYFSGVWGWLITSPAEFSDGSPPITWQNGRNGHRAEDGIMQQKLDRVVRLAWRRSHLMLCHQESWKHAPG